MNSFKKFLFHRMRSTVVLTVVLCLFAIIITTLTVNVRSYEYYDVVISDGSSGSEKTEVLVKGERLSSAGLLVAVLCIMCTVIPVLELGGLKNKRNADTVYALPIDRKKMCIAHFINGFLQILAVYGCMAITAALIITAETEGLLHLEYLASWLLLPIPAAFLLYAYFSYLFNEANSVVDGCVFIVSGILTPLFLSAAFDTVELWMNGESIYSWLDMASEAVYPYFPLVFITENFSDAIEVGRFYRAENAEIGIFVMWCVIGVLTAVCYYFAFNRKRVESIGEISSSPIGYKAIIPTLVFCIVLAMGNFNDSDSISLLIIGIIAAVIGYMIYRRSFKIKLADILSIVGSIGAVIVIRILEDIIRRAGGAYVTF